MRSVVPDGQQIRKLRDLKELSRKLLHAQAEELNLHLSESLIYKAESGKSVSRETIRAFAQLLGTSFNDLVQPAYRNVAELQERAEQPSQQAKPDGIVFDSTYLFSADSELGLMRGRDPFGGKAMPFLTTVFCGCENLRFVQPLVRPKSLTPFMELWWDLHVLGAQGGITLREADCAALVAAFRRLLVADPLRVADWACFQCGSDRTEGIFWTGGNPISALRTAKELIEPSWCLQNAPTFTDRLSANQPVLTRMGQKVAAELGGVLEYLTVYTFFAFQKGRTYSYEIPPEPAYHCHPMRRLALPDGKKLGMDETTSATLYPWGTVVKTLLDFTEVRKDRADNPVWEDTFKRRLRKLREYNLEFYSPDVFKTRRRHQGFVIEGLSEAGWIDRDLELINQLIESKSKSLRPFRQPLVEAREISDHLDHVRVHRRTKLKAAAIANQVFDSYSR